MVLYTEQPQTVDQASVLAPASLSPLLADYQPPDNGGVDKSGGSGTREWEPVKTIFAGRDGIPCRNLSLQCKWNTPVADAFDPNGAPGGMRGGASRNDSNPLTTYVSLNRTTQPTPPARRSFIDGERLNPGVN